MSLFQLRQQIASKRAESARLTSEHSALLSQHSQNGLNGVNAEKYRLSDLLTHSQCRAVLSAHQQRLEELILRTAQHRDALQSAKTQFSRLNHSHEETVRQRQTYSDTLALRRADSLSDTDSVIAGAGVASLSRVMGVDSLEVRAQSNEIVFSVASGYSVSVGVDVQRGRVMGVAVRHQKEGTRFDELGEAVMAHFESESGNGNGVALSQVQCVVREVLLLLSRLARRYSDIGRLHSEYAAHNMLPWLPESNQLVFKFEFGSASAQKRVSVPLVLSMAWNYPLQQSVAVEHYNCTLAQRDEAAEREWKEQLRLTMESVQGKFQDDIVRFVGAIYHRLQAFADSKA